jgi:hypothetical protein
MISGALERMQMVPLPRDGQREASRYGRGEGFVDEEVVRKVLARVEVERVYVRAEDMVLSSSEDDYAGWALPVASPFRSRGEDLDRMVRETLEDEVLPEVVDVEVGFEAAQTAARAGGQRWWLFGVAGATTCVILSLVMFSFVGRGLEARVSLPDQRVDEMRVEGVERKASDSWEVTGVLGDE